MNKIKVQIKRNKYVILFPKEHYSQARCTILLTEQARAQLIDVLNVHKNVCGIGFSETVYMFNVELFFVHRNAGLLKTLDAFWLYYLEL